MSSFLKKVQLGAQQVHKSAKSGQLASNLKQSIREVKSQAEQQLSEVLKVDYDRYLEKPIVLEGKIWKRRGGMAKYQNLKKPGESVWELRRFELRGNVLLYYRLPPCEEEEIQFGGTESSPSSPVAAARRPASLAESTWNADQPASPRTDDNGAKEDDIHTPRGHVDFKEEKALVHVCPGHAVGAPSPFCLSIVTVTGVTLTNYHEKTKWILSFDDQSLMMEWLTALSNVVAQCSVDGYNVQLVKASNPNRAVNDPPLLFLRRPPIKEPPKEKGGESSTVQSACHQLWIAHNNYYVLRRNDDDDADNDDEKEEKKMSHTKPIVPSPVALQEMEKQHQKELQELKQAQELYRQEFESKVETLTARAMAIATKDGNHSQVVTELEQKIQELQASEAAKIEQVTKAAAIAQRMRQQQQEKEVEKLKQQIADLQHQRQSPLTNAMEAASTEETTSANKEMAQLQHQIAVLQAAQAEKEQQAAKTAESAKLQFQKELQAVQDQQKSDQQEMQAKVEELAQAAAAAKQRHKQEIADLQQTIELLQSAPPEDDDDDEFHDAA